MKLSKRRCCTILENIQYSTTHLNMFETILQLSCPILTSKTKLTWEGDVNQAVCEHPQSRTED